MEIYKEHIQKVEEKIKTLTTIVCDVCGKAIATDIDKSYKIRKASERTKKLYYWVCVDDGFGNEICVDICSFDCLVEHQREHAVLRKTKRGMSYKINESETSYIPQEEQYGIEA